MLVFYGVGSVTMNIFLRELRPFWPKADPKPLPQVIKLASRLKIDLRFFCRKTLASVRIETGLIRLAQGRFRSAIAAEGEQARPVRIHESHLPAES
jgi:hypothetical protein